jgi:hypothetical protein
MSSSVTPKLVGNRRANVTDAADYDGMKAGRE